MSAPVDSPFPPKAYDQGVCPRCGRPLTRGCGHMVRTVKVDPSSDNAARRAAQEGR